MFINNIYNEHYEIDCKIIDKFVGKNIISSLLNVIYGWFSMPILKCF